MANKHLVSVTFDCFSYLGSCGYSWRRHSLKHFLFLLLMCSVALEGCSVSPDALHGHLLWSNVLLYTLKQPHMVVCANQLRTAQERNIVSHLQFLTF